MPSSTLSLLFSHAADPVTSPAGGPAGALVSSAGRAGLSDRVRRPDPDPYADEDGCDDWRAYVPLGVVIVVGALLDGCSILLAGGGG